MKNIVRDQNKSLAVFLTGATERAHRQIGGEALNIVRFKKISDIYFNMMDALMSFISHPLLL